MLDSFPSLIDSADSPEAVSNPTELIPVRYSGDPIPDIGRMVRMPLFKRCIFITLSRAYRADFEEYLWLIERGTPETWYFKPQKQPLRDLEVFDSSMRQPTMLDTPRVWASAALTTPTDDDIYDCMAGHSLDQEYIGACHQCTDEKSEALDNTDLVYYAIVSTNSQHSPMYGSNKEGKQIYKLIRCGSRESAAAEAFYHAGVRGCSIVFSCVFRFGETPDDKPKAVVERVDELWKLAEEAEDNSKIRVFY
ncbi:hypothetical protein BDV96DRAFT_125151 [Lophiotrema nucula]|uniref:Uncharacterized protein n=1 Tax=Lophiotrema nucula TaxID=690887 RepID=A0A6A5Z2Z8_9PLEO|nr:hypothetical protein BDV96DRAFT_125151 [Lophiotrema nucula]